MKNINKIINNKKTSSVQNKFNINLLTYSLINLFTFSKKILRFVKNMAQNRQFSLPTCFIIHVGLDRIGEKTYA